MGKHSGPKSPGPVESEKSSPEGQQKPGGAHEKPKPAGQ